MIDTWGPFRAAYIIAALVYSGYAFTILRRAKRAKDKLRAGERNA